MSFFDSIIHAMTKNFAAVSTGLVEGEISTIREEPVPTVPSDRILIRAEAYASNPVDWKLVAGGWTRKGTVLGCDVSGVVEQVGANVTGFVVGDYVSAFLRGDYSNTEGAFQSFVVANPSTIIKYDKSLFTSTTPLSVGVHPRNYINTFEGAASVTLGLCTVAMSFPFCLGLKHELRDSYKDKYILIWGGATSTGYLAIQVAKQIYGLKVIATSSPANFDLLRELGADVVFDYHDEDVVDKIRQVGGANIPYALDTVSTVKTLQAVYDSTSYTEFVRLDNLLFLDEEDIVTDISRNVAFGKTSTFLVSGEPAHLADDYQQVPSGLVEVFTQFWQDVLPKYISTIKHINLKVLHKGLDSVNEAMAIQSEGSLRGQKVVFRA
ncbi:hypothetical protein CAAN1_05S06194 [[Candida] anglica]|uniref:Enoyl reductase (ER) domain-containing protein n=1 Tax=[Candida] anglica TaxID=148631 RepID=A0ABP0EEZ7_9ASCO